MDKITRPVPEAIKRADPLPDRPGLRRYWNYVLARTFKNSGLGGGSGLLVGLFLSVFVAIGYGKVMGQKVTEYSVYVLVTLAVFAAIMLVCISVCILRTIPAIAMQSGFNISLN